MANLRCWSGIIGLLIGVFKGNQQRIVVLLVNWPSAHLPWWPPASLGKSGRIVADNIVYFAKYGPPMPMPASHTKTASAAQIHNLFLAVCFHKTSIDR